MKSWNLNKLNKSHAFPTAPERSVNILSSMRNSSGTGYPSVLKNDEIKPSGPCKQIRSDGSFCLFPSNATFAIFFCQDFPFRVYATWRLDAQTQPPPRRKKQDFCKMFEDMHRR